MGKEIGHEILICQMQYDAALTFLILQKDLDSLGLWEADWQMKFNVAKCHSMRVTRHYSHKQIIHDYTLHQQTLENVRSAKYLGIHHIYINCWFPVYRWSVM